MGLREVRVERTICRCIGRRGIGRRSRRSRNNRVLCGGANVSAFIYAPAIAHLWEGSWRGGLPIL